MVITCKHSHPKRTYPDRFRKSALLIQTFQTATSWSEISEVLKLHDEYKQQAWDALTPLEKRRVMAITPPEIKKLNEAFFDFANSIHTQPDFSRYLFI